MTALLIIIITITWAGIGLYAYRKHRDQRRAKQQALTAFTEQATEPVYLLGQRR